MIGISLFRTAHAAGIVSTFALLASCAHGAFEVTGQKPYTLQVRYGANAALAQQWALDARPGAHYLDTARKLDIDIAAVDAGRVAVRGAVFEYRARVIPERDSADIDIEMMCTGADAQRALDTRLSLPFSRWTLISATRDVTTHDGNSAKHADAVYIRLRPN